MRKYRRVHAMLRGKPEGIENGNGTISWNRCSGTSAINLAYHFGAKRIVLVGYDMKRIEAEDNWHDEHKKMHPNTHKKRTDEKAERMYKRYMSCMPAVAKDAEKLGVEIINATPGSAIEQFPMVKLEEVIDG